MPSFNQVILMGHLTRDPALKYLPNKTAVAEFGMAVNRKYKTASGEAREEVCFVECVAFAKTGENINKFFHKGDAIMVVGRLIYDSWEDKNGGGKRSKLAVNVERFEFVGGKGGGEKPADGPKPSGQPASEPVQEAEFKDSDIPW